MTGTEKARSGFGNGDCLMIDVTALVFAVADASERFPDASRKMLTRFRELISTEKGSLSRDTLRALVADLWREQPFLEKTTFSCLFIERQPDECVAHVVSGGDSMVSMVDCHSGSVLFQSTADMNFAGRGIHAPEVISLPLQRKPVRIFLATDGLNDFAKRMPCPGRSNIPQAILDRPVHKIWDPLEKIVSNCKTADAFDDLGIIAVDPFRLKKATMGLVMGGTLPWEETRFLDFRSGYRGNGWVSQSDWQTDWRRCAGEFKSAGMAIDPSPGR
jgi:hypothetical protein